MPVTKLQLPSPDPTADSVIQRKLALVGKAESQLKFKKSRLRETEEKVVSHDGASFRAGFAAQSAARREEVFGLEHRIRQLKAALQEAEQDAPRRVRLRQRAEKVAAEREEAKKKIAKMERDIAAMKERDSELAKMEREITVRAEHTPSELTANLQIFDHEFSEGR